jgi:hypothetical protein
VLNVFVLGRLLYVGLELFAYIINYLLLVLLFFQFQAGTCVDHLFFFQFLAGSLVSVSLAAIVENF